MVVSRQVSVNGVLQPLNVPPAPPQRRLPDTCLTDTQSIDDEPQQLIQAERTPACVQQTISFTDLSPELRNRIYEYTFSQHSGIETALVVTSPSIDADMTLAEQSPITMASRQTRAESLAMFYAHTKFVAYISDYNFQPLCRWVKSVTSARSAPTVKVHVKLLDQIKCEYQLLPLMRSWRNLKHETIHLKIHDFSTRMGGPSAQRRFDQRRLLAEAITTAEELRAKGDIRELKLREVCTLLVLREARYLERCDAVSASGSGCGKHGYAVKWVGCHERLAVGLMRFGCSSVDFGVV